MTPLATDVLDRIWEESTRDKMPVGSELRSMVAEIRRWRGEAWAAAQRLDGDRVREALAWYGEQARLARLIHSGGDAGRHALSDDGGKRAAAALATTPSPDASPDSGEAERDALAVARVYAEAGDWNGAYHAMRCAYDLRVTASPASLSGGAEERVRGERDQDRRSILRWVEQGVKDAERGGNTAGVWLFARQWGIVRDALIAALHPSPEAPANRQEDEDPLGDGSDYGITPLTPANRQEAGEP